MANKQAFSAAAGRALKRVSHEIYQAFFLHVWIDLVLNKCRGWFLNFLLALLFYYLIEALPAAAAYLPNCIDKLLANHRVLTSGLPILFRNCLKACLYLLPMDFPACLYHLVIN